jgi:hypothetical protein
VRVRSFALLLSATASHSFSTPAMPTQKDRVSKLENTRNGDGSLMHRTVMR